MAKTTPDHTRFRLVRQLAVLIQRRHVDDLFSLPNLFLLLTLDLVLYKYISIFGRLFVFCNGLATCYPSIMSLGQQQMRWETVFGIDSSSQVDNYGALSSVLLRHSWNRGVAGLTCMIVALLNLENHAIAVVLLGLQKLGSLGVMSMYISIGPDELTPRSRRRLSYDVQSAVLCIWFGVILIIRKRRRDSPLALYRRIERRMENRLDRLVTQLRQEGVNTNDADVVQE